MAAGSVREGLSLLLLDLKMGAGLRDKECGGLQKLEGARKQFLSWNTALPIP